MRRALLRGWRTAAVLAGFAVAFEACSPPSSCVLSSIAITSVGNDGTTLTVGVLDLPGGDALYPKGPSAGTPPVAGTMTPWLLVVERQYLGTGFLPTISYVSQLSFAGADSNGDRYTVSFPNSTRLANLWSDSLDKVPDGAFGVTPLASNPTLDQSISELPCLTGVLNNYDVASAYPATIALAATTTTQSTLYGEPPFQLASSTCSTVLSNVTVGAETVAVTGAQTGSCTLTIADATGATVTVPVTVSPG